LYFSPACIAVQKYTFRRKHFGSRFLCEDLEELFDALPAVSLPDFLDRSLLLRLDMVAWEEWCCLYDDALRVTHSGNGYR
jgi:hypothetical protein